VTRGAKARLFLGIVVLAVLAASALSQEVVAQSGPLAALRQPAPAGFFGWLLSKQGLFWAGIASTFVMGIGTAISVAAIATLAVGAKSAAKRFAATRAGYGTLMLRGVEVAAAVAVLAFGVLLLTGTMASERMGMF